MLTAATVPMAAISVPTAMIQSVVVSAGGGWTDGAQQLGKHRGESTLGRSGYPPASVASLRSMSRATLALPPVTLLLTILVSAPAYGHCVGRTPYGDQVGPANRFDAQHMTCSDAITSAAQYVDTANADSALIAVGVLGKPVAIRFTSLVRGTATAGLAGSLNCPAANAEGTRRQLHLPRGSRPNELQVVGVSRAALPECRISGRTRVTRNEPCPRSTEILEPGGEYETRTGTGHDESASGEPLSYTWERRYYHDGAFACVRETNTQSQYVTWECKEHGFNAAGYTWRERAV